MIFLWTTRSAIIRCNECGSYNLCNPHPCTIDKIGAIKFTCLECGAHPYVRTTVAEVPDDQMRIAASQSPHARTAIYLPEGNRICNVTEKYGLSCSVPSNIGFKIVKFTDSGIVLKSIDGDPEQNYNDVFIPFKTY